MTNNMRILAILLLSLLLPAMAQAKRPGTASATFLNLPASPQAAAMANAMTAITQDAVSIFYNPAGLGRISNPQGVFAYNLHFQDTNRQDFAYAHPFPKIGAFNLFIRRLGVKSFESLDAQANPLGSVSASDLVLGLGYGRKIAAKGEEGKQRALFAGLSASYIQEKLASVSGKAISGSAGLLATQDVKKGTLSFGLSALNLGTKMKFDREKASLPRAFRVGLGVRHTLWNEPFTFSLDGVLPADDKIRVSIGAEQILRDLVILRAGYESGHGEGPGVSAGLGLMFQAQKFSIGLHYGVQLFGGLGTTHLAGMTIGYGPKPKRAEARPVRDMDKKEEAGKAFERGMALYKEGDLRGAMMEFNQALRLDPLHPEAMGMMKKISEELEKR